MRWPVLTGTLSRWDGRAGRGAGHELGGQSDCSKSFFEHRIPPLGWAGLPVRCSRRGSSIIRALDNSRQSIASCVRAHRSARWLIDDATEIHMRCTRRSSSRSRVGFAISTTRRLLLTSTA